MTGLLQGGQLGAGEGDRLGLRAAAVGVPERVVRLAILGVVDIGVPAVPPLTAVVHDPNLQLHARFDAADPFPGSR